MTLDFVESLIVYVNVIGIFQEIGLFSSAT